MFWVAVAAVLLSVAVVGAIVLWHRDDQNADLPNGEQPTSDPNPPGVSGVPNGNKPTGAPNPPGVSVAPNSESFVVLTNLGPDDQPLIKAVAEDGGWRFDFDKPGTYKVFQFPVTPPGPGKFIYQVEIKSANVHGECSLHLGNAVAGKEGGQGYVWGVQDMTTWSSRQASSAFLRPEALSTPFFLELDTPGAGTVWIRNVRFLHEKVATPQQLVAIPDPDRIQVEPQGMPVLNGHQSWMALAPDGKTLALVGPEGKLHLWHGRGNQWQAGQTFPVSHGDPLGFSPNGAFLVSGSNVFAREKDKWKQVAIVPCNTPGLAFSPDSKVIFRTMWTSDINAYQLPHGKALERVHVKDKDFVFKDQGQPYARAVHDQQMGAWRIEVQGQELFAHDHMNAYQVVATRDGMTVATAPSPGIGVTRIWKKDQGHWKKHADWPAKGVNLALGLDDQVLAIGSGYGLCQLRDITTGEVLAALHGHQGQVFSLAFGPDGTLYTSSADGHIGVWKIKLLKPPAPGGGG
jgi:WD40 repeat protein